MSRELKFRAWIKDEGEMRYPSSDRYIKFNGDCYYIVRNLANSRKQIFQRENPDNIELMQYTGLKDRNGKEIYEGDMPNGIYKGMYIQWCNQCASFALFLNNATCTSCENDIFWNDFLDDINEIEIIGNIYENPELLGEWTNGNVFTKIL